MQTEYKYYATFCEICRDFGEFVWDWIGLTLLLHGSGSQYELDKEEDCQGDEDEHLPELFGDEGEPNAEEHATQVELHLAVGAVEFGAEFAVTLPGRPE
ncbi:MAG: hypothetical protein CVU41_09415 [Chloroflexi bacterium HGW-Chloroflexi-3]|nr:MAG: hypothetical protein CVU41_09415 [Chloroflexi bacterium HGW-Chloroflexi-3]